MKVYVVRYRWEEIIETIYEYIISRCEKLFGVVNRPDCLFRIEPDSQNKCLTIGLMHDDNEQFFMDYLKHHELKDTGLHDVQLLSSCHSLYTQRSDSHDLSDKEIRYMKLNFNHISDLMISIVAELMNLKKIFSVMKREDPDLYNIYISKFDFKYETLDKENDAIQFVDKTTDIVGKFL